MAHVNSVPESPRWLVENGHDQKALEILCRLHRDVNDPQDHFAHRELDLIRNQHEFDKAAILADGRWQLFTQKTYRKRMILATMLILGGQNVGILVINNYSFSLYTSLGLSHANSLLVGAGWNTCAALGNFVGAAFSDRFGRRKILGKNH